MLSSSVDFKSVFRQGTTIFSNGLMSFLKPNLYLELSPYLRKTNNFFGEIDNFEVNGNTTVGKDILQEHILKSSIFGGYTQFGDRPVMTISIKRIGHKYEGIWNNTFRPLSMKNQLDLNKVMEFYYERVMMLDSYFDRGTHGFICYTKHTDSGILEFRVNRNRDCFSKITIPSDNKLKFIK